MTNEDPSYTANAYGQFYHGIGERADRPFKFLVPLNVTSFGDVFISVSAAARVAAQFEHSWCNFVFRPDRPFTEDVISFYPFEKNYFFTKKQWRELYLNSLMSPIGGYDFKQGNYHDFMMTSMMLTSSIFGSLPRVPLLIPERHHTKLKAALLDLGLEPDRWFCTLHWREPNYRFKIGSTMRDGEPERYLPAIDYIIDKLGGQVIQLGHPEMVHHTPRRGLVDLSVLPDSWLLQAFAVSRARFFVGSTSGASGMAHAFNIPAAHLDVLDWYVGEAGDLLVTPTVTVPDGRVLRQHDLFASGWMNTFTLKKAQASGRSVTIKNCSTEDVLRATRAIHDRTLDVTEWRNPVLVRPTPTNHLSLPPRAGRSADFLDL